MTEKEAFEVEAALIDFGNYAGFDLTNLVDGHHAQCRGLMTSDEVIRRYNAKPLNQLKHNVMVINININKKYQRERSSQAIYEATKQAWVIGEQRRTTTQYALAKYTGIIIKVIKKRVRCFLGTLHGNLKNV